MNWKDLQMMLMQMPICELKKPISLRLESGEPVRLKINQDSPAVGELSWKYAEGFKDLHFTVGGK